MSDVEATERPTPQTAARGDCDPVQQGGEAKGKAQKGLPMKYDPDANARGCYDVAIAMLRWRLRIVKLLWERVRR